jgi:hypothetical protein
LLDSTYKDKVPTKIQLREETEEKQKLADEVPPLDTITTRKDITIVGYSPNLLKNATGEVLTMIIKVSYKTLSHEYRGSVRFMVFNTTFNNISVISWQSVLLVEETGENHRLVTCHWQFLTHIVVSSTPCSERGSNSQL